MSCPSVEELLAGAAPEHAAECDACRAVLALAATRATPIECARVEALLAARAAGALPSGSEPMLLQHLEACAACFQLARELEAPVVADAVRDAADGDGDFTELAVVATTCYVRGQEIGRGGMGRIVRARDRRLGREVAIKELIDERMRARFEREARLTAKLQHPAIVSVHEAGRWPSGDPFYAMKYVAGRPLDQVVARMSTLDERLGLLPKLTTVVEAIAYAHSEHVIHRDLKPQNILIGAFGEVVVIDWGLAKDLRTPADASTPYRDDDVPVTRAGAGTPAYMAPEQTRGELPDERVDVYALGATLHHVLSGERPGVRPLPAETPRDLRDIVGKAMAKDREHRYRTAAELAGELRRFQEGQLVLAHRYTPVELVRRFLRRHRRMVTLAAGFAVVLAVVATVSVRRVVAERDRAEAQRRGAEGLVDFMLGTLAERLKPMGRLDALAGLGKEVEGYYASVSSERESDPKVLRRRAEALDLLADVDREKGNYDDVHVEAARTVELCERLDRIAPSTWAAACVVHALMRRGYVETDRGRVDAALDWFRQADERLDVALARAPADAVLRRTRGAIARWVARAYVTRGDYDRGRAAFARGIQVIDGLVAANPGRVGPLETLASLEENLGDLEMDDGRPDAAIAQYSAAVAVWYRVGALRTGDVTPGVVRAQTFASIAAAAMELGQYALARAVVDPTLAFLRRHVDEDPANHTWRSWLASTVDWGCEAALGAGRLDDAARLCFEAEATAASLAAINADDEVSAQNLVAAEASLADVRREQGDLVGARAGVDKAVAVAVAWTRRKPGDGGWLVSLSRGYYGLALVERAAGATAAARAAAWTALALIVGVARTRTDFSVELAAARAETLAGELDADDAAAEQAFRRVGDRLARAEARWPRVVAFAVARAHAMLGLADVVDRRPDGGGEARALRAGADAILEPLALRGALAYDARDLLARARGGVTSPAAPAPRR